MVKVLSVFDAFGNEGVYVKKFLFVEHDAVTSFRKQFFIFAVSGFSAVNVTVKAAGKMNFWTGIADKGRL